MPAGSWDKLKPLAREQRHEPTEAEQALWQQLRNRQLSGRKFRRQHGIERFVVDFYCAQAWLVIEVDGPIHRRTQEEDAIRQEILEAMGLTVLRSTNDQVLSDHQSVLTRIRSTLAKTPDSPSPPGGEGAGG